jgi:hypothetical protein
MAIEKMFDIYRDKKDHALRLATLPGAGLLAHVDAAEWELMAPGTSQIHKDAASDIAALGFCLFRLLDPN